MRISGRGRSSRSGRSRAHDGRSSCCSRRSSEDPNYALAYSMMADLQAVLMDARNAPHDKLLAEADRYASQAVALSPDLPDAQLSVGCGAAGAVAVDRGPDGVPPRPRAGAAIGPRPSVVRRSAAAVRALRPEPRSLPPQHRHRPVRLPGTVRVRPRLVPCRPPPGRGRPARSAAGAEGSARRAYEPRPGLRLSGAGAPRGRRSLSPQGPRAERDHPPPGAHEQRRRRDPDRRHGRRRSPGAISRTRPARRRSWRASSRVAPLDA